MNLMQIVAPRNDVFGPEVTQLVESIRYKLARAAESHRDAMEDLEELKNLCYKDGFDGVTWKENNTPMVILLHQNGAVSYPDSWLKPWEPVLSSPIVGDDNEKEMDETKHV